MSGKEPIIYLCATVTARGRYALFCREDGMLDCFRLESGKYEGSIKVHDAEVEVLGVTHHPNENLLVTFADNGELSK